MAVFSILDSRFSLLDLVLTPTEHPANSPVTTFPSLRPRIAALLLVLVMAGGFVLRTWNINFDQGLGSHPDERSTSSFYAAGLRLPESWQQFLDPTQSPLNPLWDVGTQTKRGFTYGHLPLYLGVAAGEGLHAAAPLAARLGVPAAAVEIMATANDAWSSISVAGRLVIAIFDTVTILLVFLLTTRLYRNVAGLLAALLYAFTAQAVQLSHFFAMDPASTTFTVWAVLGGVIMIHERRGKRFWRGAWAAGLGCGLAIASKFSAIPVLAVPVVAALLALYAESRAARTAGVSPDGRVQARALAGALLALLVAPIAFTLTSPYAVLDWRNFLQNTLVEQGAMVRGVADFPFTRQYRNTVPYLYFIQQQVVWGLGLPLGLAALAGGGWGIGRMFGSLWRMVRRRFVGDTRLGELVIWAWVLPYFGITGLFLAKFNRYMSPVLPFVLVFTAGLILWLLRPAKIADLDGASIRHGVGGLLGGLAIVGAVVWTLAYVNGVYGREHTWIAASRWIYANAPHGSLILWEQWDDPLPKQVPGEPARMIGGPTDCESPGAPYVLCLSDWGPYEEDTAEKYEILKQKLQATDYVIYSSKRIYDSVDELPARYPMTNLYYQSMWDGSLGFELAAEFTSPPSLLGLRFDDRHADESWSLYDHAQVSVFRKVRDLSDEEFDALLGGSWEEAVPWDRGGAKPWAPLLNALGMGGDPEQANAGLLNRTIGAIMGTNVDAPAEPPDPTDLLLSTPLRELPAVDNFRWNRTASQSTPLAVLTWWAVLALLGWIVWPLLYWLLHPLRDRGYLLSRTAGLLLAGWLMWLAASLHIATFTVRNGWIVVGVLAVVGAVAAWRQRRSMGAFLRRRWPLLLLGELLFAVAYLGFVGIRLLNPDIWQPWYGGEKFMEMAFLTGILRSPWFPPVDPHFAGGFINYYYFGIYLVAYLIKLTGIWAEVAFNLAIPSLFALTVAGAFAVAHSALAEGARLPRRAPHKPEPQPEVLVGGLPVKPEPDSAAEPFRPRPEWRNSLAAAGVALLAPLFVAIIGNLDGFGQIVRNLGALATTNFESALPLLQPLVRAGSGLQQVLVGGAQLADYGFWEPSRVIPYTINEFPWWSFVFADLHPHLIGMPLALLFLGLVLTLVQQGATRWRERKGYAIALLLSFGLLLGALASVNLWELPTYFALGVLALALSQYLGRGRVLWGRIVWASLLYALVAGLSFAPFFIRYTNVGASGVGLVRTGDDLGLWLLIWGFFVFVLGSWLCWQAARPARRTAGGSTHVNFYRLRHPAGAERLLSAGLRHFDRLPRLLHLLPAVGWRPALGTLLLLALLPLSLLGAGLALWFERSVLALCLPLLTLAFVLLWRRGRAATPGTQFAMLLTVAGFAILAGTQLVYLKDFLGGGDWYRMNTLFKFFSQVWVLFGVAAAVATAQMWRGWVRHGQVHRVWRVLWAAAFVLLLGLSLSYTFVGTPARLSQRLVGWRPPIGTLDGLAYMEQGSYTWPNDANTIELAYDREAIRWLLDQVGVAGSPVPLNAVVMETSETDYYRAGASRIASLTGLSGLRGFHAGEQRWSEQLAPREAAHREFWSTGDPARMQQILAEQQVDLVYVGQLERYLHPDAALRLEQLAAEGALTPLFSNARTTIYGVPQAEGVPQADGVLRADPVAQEGAG